MTKDSVDDIEIDTRAGLLKARVGDTEITVDLLRPSAKRLTVLLREMADDLRKRPETGGKDNCDDCVSACCTGWAMGITTADVTRLQNGLKLSMTKLHADHIDPYGDSSGGYATPYQLRHVKDTRFERGSRCNFLKVKLNADKIAVGRCSIYEHRPQVCRDFPAHNCDAFVPATNLLRRLREPRVDK